MLYTSNIFKHSMNWRVPQQLTFPQVSNINSLHPTWPPNGSILLDPSYRKGQHLLDQKILHGQCCGASSWLGQQGRGWYGRFEDGLRDRWSDPLKFIPHITVYKHCFQNKRHQRSSCVHWDCPRPSRAWRVSHSGPAWAEEGRWLINVALLNPYTWVTNNNDWNTEHFFDRSKQVQPLIWIEAPNPPFCFSAFCLDAFDPRPQQQQEERMKQYLFYPLRWLGLRGKM